MSARQSAAFVAISFALVVAGCTSSEFVPYQGAQENWPTAPGAFVDRKHSVPVYYGPPPRPYSVLGYLSIGNGRTKSGNLSIAADKARAAGGDGIIVIKTGSQYAGTYSTGSAVAYGSGNSASAFGSGISIPIAAVESTVAVIKFR